MSKLKQAPEVNAGSMADIAFLLLIFFLVTASIETDVGLNRILPRESADPYVEIKARNLLEIGINAKNQLMVEGDILALEELRTKVVSFIDNGGLQTEGKDFCGYCKGERLAHLSEHPDKAIISIKTSRDSNYAYYVSVQNEIIGAYNFLRNRESSRLYGVAYETLVQNYGEDIGPTEKMAIKGKIEAVRAMFPQKIIEPEIIHQ